MAEGKSPLGKGGRMNFRESPDDIFRLWRIPFNQELDPSKVMIALRERIKELNCLYGIAQLAEIHSHSIED
ncbi:MAG: hypothetical protein ABII06_07310, partial [Pseudomonadota bacterium]